MYSTSSASHLPPSWHRPRPHLPPTWHRPHPQREALNNGTQALSNSTSPNPTAHSKLEIGGMQPGVRPNRCAFFRHALCVGGAPHAHACVNPCSNPVGVGVPCLASHTLPNPTAPTKLEIGGMQPGVRRRRCAFSARPSRGMCSKCARRSSSVFSLPGTCNAHARPRLLSSSSAR